MKYRMVSISDTHLGTRACQADLLLEFLTNLECETLYLVGDIIDVWAMKSGLYWPQTHNAIVRQILKLAQNGTRVIYVPGNHDEIFRAYVGNEFGGIQILDSDIHVTATGKRLWVIHGDQFDAIVTKHKWIAHLGAVLYDGLLRMNTAVHWVRDKLNLEYWSLSMYLKHKAKAAVDVMMNFGHVLAVTAKAHGVDGVICGHIHKAEIKQIEGIEYLNDGDWVESCTALVEHLNGEMEILHYRSDRK